MFRLWGKIMKDHHMLRDYVAVSAEPGKTRTARVLDSVDQICREFDLAHPIWLDKTIEEFRRHDKARFGRDNFIEEIPFDYLEIQVLEE